ncbi:MAG: hypothetical protein HGB37_01555 [Candidatus Moranbacteria bacterium]|nr:hypothetical protein [Candidatus Moranbacteria bacterium]
MSRVVPNSHTELMQGSAAALTNNILTSDGSPILMDLFDSVVVQLSGTFVGTVIFECSNDGINWSSCALVPVAGGSATTSATSAGQWYGMVPTVYFRIRVSAYTSGTRTATVLLSTQPIVGLLNTVSASINGNAGHDAVDSSNPVKVGGRAGSADRAAVANADRVDAMFDLLGKQVMVALGVRAQMVQMPLILTTTTETTLLAAAGAGVYVDPSWMMFTNTSASAVRVDIRAATAGTVLLSVNVPAGETVRIDFSDVPMLQPVANENWTAQLSAAITDLRILAAGVKRTA